ncbi:MAG: hypothetical protein SAL07_03200 [Oscillatoria sp. PMC 1051.18]|nr:hypothetical protein [Oscillatoria sp. PMC 1050.18]MEC5028896.1 hypothetical protein [Oscillatoria sp. PMC 1051.18]
MSPQLKDIFTKIDSLNKEEQLEVLHYLEQRVQEEDKVEKRQSLNESGDDPEQSAYDLALKLGVIGAAKNLPPDLSSNKEYLSGFGG